MTQAPPTPSGRARMPEISEQYLKQLGRVVVAGSRLEATATTLAAAMKVDRLERPEIDTALRDADERARAGMPPWTAVTAEKISRWAAGARQLLGDRTRLFAATAEHRFTGSDGDAVRMPTADGTVIAADERFLDRFLTRLLRHATHGADLAVRLDYLDPRGTGWPLAAWHVLYRDPERAAAMPWYPDRVAQLPADWRRWLDAD